MSALSSSPLSAHVYRNCAHSHGKSIQAVACPILVTPLVSRIHEGTSSLWRELAPLDAVDTRKEDGRRISLLLKNAKSSG